MKTYFTSDFHLGSTNIIHYCKRPFKNVSQMNDTLIRRVNKLDRHDVLFHVGDFILHGYDRHDIKEDFSDIKLYEYLDQIKPHIILLNGNHDTGHNVKAMLNSAVVNLNRKYRNVSVSHFPLTKRYDTLKIHLCGHVLNLNVGVDVWDYRLVDNLTLAKVLDDLLSDKELMSKSFSLTKLQFQELRHQYNLKRAEQQIQNKEEKHLRKGLTKEECERRKYEAMKKKGLIKFS